MHICKCRGFTMVEMLVVISIIVILAGLLGSGLMSARKSSQNEATRAILARLTVALNTYKGDFKTYPLYYPSSNTTISDGSNTRQFPGDVVFNPVSGASYEAGKHKNGRGNNRVLGGLWGRYKTSNKDGAGTPYTRTKSEMDNTKNESPPTYLRDANLEPDAAVDNNIVDLWGQPIIYVYLVAYPVRSTPPTNAGRTLTRWSAQQLGDANAGRMRITTYTSSNSSDSANAPFGRPAGSSLSGDDCAPMPWKNDLDLYPFAAEFELWSAGPDRKIDNKVANGSGDKSSDWTASYKPSGNERMHNLSHKDNRDNISGAQWKMD